MPPKNNDIDEPENEDEDAPLTIDDLAQMPLFFEEDEKYETNVQKELENKHSTSHYKKLIEYQDAFKNLKDKDDKLRKEWFRDFDKPGFNAKKIISDLDNLSRQGLALIEEVKKFLEELKTVALIDAELPPSSSQDGLPKDDSILSQVVDIRVDENKLQPSASDSSLDSENEEEKEPLEEDEDKTFFGDLLTRWLTRPAQPSQEEVKQLNIARSRARKEILYETLLGGLVGASIGAVITLVTGGAGFLFIPILTVAFAARNAKNAYFLSENFAHIHLERKIPPKDIHHEVGVFKDLFLGAGVGATAGLTIGLFLAPFTFGISVGVCTAIGAGLGVLDTIIKTTDNYFTRKSFSIKNKDDQEHATHNRDKINKKASNQTKQKFNAYDNALLFALGGAAIGIIFALPTMGISILAGSIVGGMFGFGTSKLIKIPPYQNPEHLTKHFSTGGGAALGASIGAGIGFLTAGFTFGLSIPACALIGAFVGGFIGRFVIAKGIIAIRPTPTLSSTIRKTEESTHSREPEPTQQFEEKDVRYKMWENEKSQNPEASQTHTLDKKQVP